MELDIQRGAHISRATRTVLPGEDLQQTTQRAVYGDVLVQNIGCKAGDEYLELSHLETPLRIGEAVGDVDADAMKRLMIRRTIEEHLDKEVRLAPHGIKVLSLFFIDVVEHYRRYSENGPQEGKYALISASASARSQTTVYRNRLENGLAATECIVRRPNHVHCGESAFVGQRHLEGHVASECVAQRRDAVPSLTVDSSPVRTDPSPRRLAS